MKPNVFIIDLIDLEATLMDVIYDANPDISYAEVKEIVVRIYHYAIDNNRLREI